MPYRLIVSLKEEMALFSISHTSGGEEHLLSRCGSKVVDLLEENEWLRGQGINLMQ